MPTYHRPTRPNIRTLKLGEDAIVQRGPRAGQVGRTVQVNIEQVYMRFGTDRSHYLYARNDVLSLAVATTDLEHALEEVHATLYAYDCEIAKPHGQRNNAMATLLDQQVMRAKQWAREAARAAGATISDGWERAL